MSHELLIETLLPHQAKTMVETVNNDGSKDLYLSGIFMQSEIKNGNGRNYPMKEIASAVEHIQKCIKEENYIAGELNHPDHLSIDLERVSHFITDIRMEGNDAVGKAKIIERAPMGQIAKALLESGLRLGVSSRGTGDVYEGVVSNFNFITIDIVATPSAPSAYPKAIRESLEMLKNGKEIVKLSEAVLNDKKAQEYFAKEMRRFIEHLMTGK